MRESYHTGILQHGVRSLALGLLEPVEDAAHERGDQGSTDLGASNSLCECVIFMCTRINECNFV